MSWLQTLALGSTKKPLDGLMFLNRMTPTVSIITATYNRSNILSFTIRSVLKQDYSDWELLVVGDGCTDDTEQVVNSFQDSRIRFINLPTNFGEQSAPNNEGLRLAKGGYIAFLNHDDLWFPDHLSSSIECLETNDADLVLAAGFIDHDDEENPFNLSGILSKPHGYHPSRLFVPASNWLFKRELIAEVGHWTPASELYLVPSHDWLARVHKLNKKIVPTKKFTVLAVPSSSRKEAYSKRLFKENEWHYTQLTENPYFREEMLAKRLYQRVQFQNDDTGVYLKRYLVTKIKNILIRFGVNTMEIRYRKKFGKGGILKLYRQRRGLEPKSH